MLDDDLLSIVSDGDRAEITIVGGSALILLGITPDTRVTTDVDVMETAIQAERLLSKYDMNDEVETFAYRLPEHWRNRRQKIPFDGAAIDVYTPSNEDLAILKLYAYRDIDIMDLHDMVRSNSLDFEVLQSIINDDAELRINFNSEDEWQVFLEHFKELLAFGRSQGASE
jgi:hypothetical protein